MSFPAMNPQVVVVALNDPGADDQQVPVFRAPKSCEVVSAYLGVQGAQDGTNASEIKLQKNDGSTVSDMSDVLGGTVLADRLAAGSMNAFTISEGTLAAGDVVEVDYQLNGTAPEVNMVLVLEVVWGKGAN
jgi:hypothetical protein